MSSVLIKNTLSLKIDSKDLYIAQHSIAWLQRIVIYLPYISEGENIVIVDTYDTL